MKVERVKKEVLNVCFGSRVQWIFARSFGPALITGKMQKGFVFEGEG